MCDRGRRILIYVHETDIVRLRNIWDCVEKRDENGLENWFNATACWTMFELELFQTWVVSSKCGSNATRLLLDTSAINTHAEVRRKMVADFSCMFSFVKKCFTSNLLQKLSELPRPGGILQWWEDRRLSPETDVWKSGWDSPAAEYSNGARRFGGNGDIKARRLRAAAAVQPTSGLF